jgi:hypothetical protein
METLSHRDPTGPQELTFEQMAALISDEQLEELAGGFLDTRTNIQPIHNNCSAQISSVVI